MVVLRSPHATVRAYDGVMAYDNGNVIEVRANTLPNTETPIKGNVLVLGNPGVGKSTLINAVIGDTVAKTSFGTRGTTSELAVYESPTVPLGYRFNRVRTVSHQEPQSGACGAQMVEGERQGRS